MAVLRSETQNYATAAALTAETLVPQANDTVSITATKRIYVWDAASTATADGQYVIAQTAVATGRWIIAAAANVATGSGTTDALANGQVSNITVTVTGVTASTANVIALTNADTFPANVFVTSQAVTAANTVRLTIENQSGAAVAAFPINVSVLTF